MINLFMIFQNKPLICNDKANKIRKSSWANGTQLITIVKDAGAGIVLWIRQKCFPTNA